MRSTTYGNQRAASQRAVPWQESLPLFPPPGVTPGSDAGPDPRVEGPRVEGPRVIDPPVKSDPSLKKSRSSGPEIVNRHLKAARSLSRKMRRIPDCSPEQTIAGQAICQHLRAFLREAQAERLAQANPAQH